MTKNAFEFSTAGHDEWLTPRHITDSLGPFDLDPCSPINRPWDTASKHLTKEDDGLSVDWHGVVWMNPPYGKETSKWMDRLKKHGNGMALIFARTETRCFFDHIWDSADALLFVKGRIPFCYVDGRQGKPSGAPSVLIAYGQECSDRLLVASCSTIPGKYIRL